MATVLIVAPVFALIAAGYASVLFRFVSEGAHKGISEFAFSIAIPALLFRTIVVSDFPDVSPYRMWGAYYGALALTWTAALLISALLRERREDREDGVVFAIGSVYGNIVMLGIPLVLSALGNEAAGADVADPVGQHAAAVALRHFADGVRQPQEGQLASRGAPARARRSRAQSADARHRLWRGLALHRPRPQPGR
ncbi:AEC family transporter [Bradyrhizobium sp. USDA 4449]